MGQERGAARWRLRDVLGDAWRDNLDAIAQDGQVDLVCFTGDLAFSGKPEQYREAGEGIEFLLQALKLDKSRFFCVPGNHDIDRDLEEDPWRQLRDAKHVRPEDFDPWIAGGRPPRGCDAAWVDAVLRRRSAYDDWLTAFGLDRLRPAHHRHGRLGYRITFAPGELGNAAPLHLVGFDSAWLAGGGDKREEDNANLRLTAEQIGRLLSDDNGEPLTGHAIGLMHHPFSNLIERESQSMPGLMSRMGLNLLLHGHLHDLRLSEWNSPRDGLYISSAGSQYQRNDVPNTIHLLDIDLSDAASLRPAAVWVRAWSPDGFWHDDNSRYAGMQNGRLRFASEAPDPLSLDPGIFVGRKTELEQLCAALLPEAGGSPKPAVVEGMPGVGKSRLVEEFVRRHWLPAQGIVADVATTAHVLRIELRPDDNRDALSLGRVLADSLHLTGPDDGLWAQLRDALRQGIGGRPRLLRVDNVDGPAQAETAAKLAGLLQGCAMVFSARQRGWAGVDWERVATQPLPLPMAAELLQEKVRELDPQWVPQADGARKLATELGCLPLALHVAASHLAGGMSADEFGTRFHAQRLALAHAHPGGASSEMDEARRIVRSSFELSWAQWCAGDGDDPAVQAGLVALAQSGIESLGDDLGAHIAGLQAADYGHLLVGARRLSLLELEAVRDREDDAPRRLLRLHPLMAEFLRDKPGPTSETVRSGLNSWLLPKIADRDEQTMRTAREVVQRETPALRQWLRTATPEDGVGIVVACAEYANDCGPYSEWFECFERWQEICTHDAARAQLCWAMAHMAEKRGDPDNALAVARRAVDLYLALGHAREAAIMQGKIADILRARGELEEALRIRREEQIPVYERLDDVRERAIAQGKIADILQARGELEEALRIRRDEELPVYERLGDVRSRAITQGQIADILQARGELDEALRIRREEELPVYERLGDVRSRAITQGRIADILQVRGELEEALRIRREEELPVYERLGDVRSRAITQGQTAEILQSRGDLEEALRIHRDEILPVVDRLGDVKGRAVTQGRIADILKSRGNLEEALRIRREEELPVYERLGDVRELLVGRTNLAITLLQRGWTADRPEILALLQQALAEAERLRLHEAANIRGWIAHIFDGDDDSPDV